MLQEIYYTSAQRGLKSGSRGFCTVVSTSGMAKNLAERLESLSGYRHVFAPQDSRAALNPLAAMHLRLSIAGRPCDVLSRICDAGLDYTQRTNKFAHHVVLDEGELPAAGPAWLLTAPGFMHSTWDGEPRTLPPGRRVPAGNSEAGVCRDWQKLTGDAGWGGVLAETALPTSQRQAVIVFAPGMDVLALVQESLALLPPRLRWSVTFSTYYTKLPPGVECKWRFVVEGSPEAQAARATPQTLLLQLGNKLPPAMGGALVEAARTGVAPVIADAPRADVAIGGATNASIEELESMLAEAAEDEESGAMDGRAIFGIGPPPVPGELQALGSLPPIRPRATKKKKRWPLIAAGLAVLVMLVGAGVTGVIVWNGGWTVSSTKPSDGSAIDSGNVAPVKGLSSDRDKSAEAAIAAEKEIAAAKAKAAADELAAKVKEAEAKDAEQKKQAAALAAAQAEEAKARAKEKADALAAEELKKAEAIRQEINSWTSRVADYCIVPALKAPAQGSPEPFTASLPLNLTLFGERSAALRPFEFRLKRDGDKNRWIVELGEANVGVDKRESLSVGEFYAAKDGLLFKWGTVPTASDQVAALDKLRRCMLQIDGPGATDTRIVALQSPLQFEPLQFDFDNAKHRKIDLPLTSLPVHIGSFMTWHLTRRQAQLRKSFLVISHLISR